MRITSTMLARTIVDDSAKASARLMRSLQDAGTGKKVTQPSDDPFGVFQSLLARRDLQETQNSESNLKVGQDLLQGTETGLGQVVTLLQRARELAVQGASDSLTASERQALAKQVDSLLGEMVDLGNTRSGGVYVFGGTKTTTAPFTKNGSPVTSVTYHGDDGLRQVAIGPGQSVTTNVPGSTLFVNGVNLFDTLTQLRSSLEANDGNTISTQVIGQLDAGLDKATTWQSFAGAVQQRLQRQETSLQQSLTTLQGRISDIEDTDLAATSIDIATGQTALQAFLTAAGRIASQPNLITLMA